MGRYLVHRTKALIERREMRLDRDVISVHRFHTKSKLDKSYLAGLALE